MEDGLTQPSVMCIYQDTLGRMWFGTREGVNIYDGEKIKNFRPSKINNNDERYYIASNEVYNFLGDSNGDIYIHVGKRLYRFDIRQEKLNNLYTQKEVTASANSKDKNIWFSTKDSLFLYNCQRKCLTTRLKSRINDITTLVQSNDSTLYLGTKSGLYSMNLISGTPVCILPNIDIRNLLLSSKKELWIGSRTQGLYIRRKDGIITKEPISPKYVVSNQIRQIIEDKEKNIWFGTFDGLQKYDPYKNEYTVYTASDRTGSLSHSSIFSLYEDRQGTLWAGSYYGGVCYLYPKRFIDHIYSCNVLRDDCLNFPHIGDMIEDKEKNIWIATDGGGVNCLNHKTQKFTYYTKGENSIKHNNVKSLAYDRNRDHIYVGTHTGGLSRIDRKTGKVYNFLEEKSKIGPNDIIFHLEFYNNYLYISARNGFWRYSPITDKFDLLDDYHYYVNFEIDKKGYAWLSFQNNIKVIDLNSPQFTKKLKSKNRLHLNGIITHIYQASNDLIYITTSGNGMYYYNQETKELKQLTRENSKLLSNYCYNVIETPNNNILITTATGISIYSPITHDVYSFEGYKNKGMSPITNECGLLVASDKLIYIGGSNGMISFNENNVLYNNHVIAQKGLYFSNLKVNDSYINPGDDSGILELSLPYTKKVILPAAKNNFTIEYSSSNYITFLRNTWYQYRLEGFDENWKLTTNNSLNYTNLPAGKYILRIKEKRNLINFMPEEEISIPIEVLSPWYNKWYAYLIYFIILSIIVYTIWHIILSKKLFAISLENEKKEKERIEEMNKMKLRFFTNISHELRTPLTLIAGQVEMLVQDRVISLSVRRKINRIYQNTLHMRNLISELLDFRKQDQGFLKLKVQENDIVEFTHNIYITFKDYAIRRNIKYEFEYVDDKPIMIWFDALQLQKAIFNLLSNAFKYTKEKGNIILRLQQTENGVNIEVEDTGKGIANIDMKHIFDRFYLAGELDSQVTSRTGIGLALTKGIVELHHGTINVVSEVGKGSIFRINLLNGNSHFSEEELANKDMQIDPKSALEEKFYEAQLDMDIRRESMNEQQSGKDYDETETAKNNKPCMLIVEDDADIIDMLEEIFSAIYKIAKAHNGKEGLDMANELQPDIIVSDIMMPVMSGKEMCSRIKDSVETSHIPVVLLTAQTTDEQTLEGYMLGADAYITKPFNIRLLVAKCNNLINNRRILMSKLKETSLNPQSNGTENTTSSMALNAIDQKLIDQATEIIKANFDNSAFNMDMLAAELNMGRSKLYSRFKEITGITPNEFTLRLKLEQGKQLLINSPELNISEISYKLGFSSLRYFSKCFKSFCGVTPLDFRKNANGQQA